MTRAPYSHGDAAQEVAGRQVEVALQGAGDGNGELRQGAGDGEQDHAAQGFAEAEPDVDGVSRL